jgi:hypothetical protein
MRVPQLVKKFPVLLGTRRFLTVFVRARHICLAWAKSFLSLPWRNVLIFSSHLSLCLPSDLFTWGFPTKTPYSPLLFLIRSAKTYTPNESKKFSFMNVGLKTRVAKSPRLVAFVVPPMTGGRSILPPFVPLRRKLWWLAIHQDDMTKTDPYTRWSVTDSSVVMWIWLEQVGRRNECSRKHSSVPFSCWRPAGEFVFKVVLSKDIRNQC